jgi:hypothetical protein
MTWSPDPGIHGEVGWFRDALEIKLMGFLMRWMQQHRWERNQRDFHSLS